MFINFWYPMIRSDDLGPGKPERSRVLGPVALPASRAERKVAQKATA